MMISREEAIEYFAYCLTELKMDTEDIREAYELAIEALSNERPKGRWYTAEAHNGYLYWNCNQCHGHFTSQKSNYCPNCGADMREAEE